MALYSQPANSCHSREWQEWQELPIYYPARGCQRRLSAEVRARAGSFAAQFTLDMIGASSSAPKDHPLPSAPEPTPAAVGKAPLRFMYALGGPGCGMGLGYQRVQHCVHG